MSREFINDQLTCCKSQRLLSIMRLGSYANKYRKMIRYVIMTEQQSLENCALTYKLSISVAEVQVILVGLVMKGAIPLFINVSRSTEAYLFTLALM